MFIVEEVFFMDELKRRLNQIQNNTTELIKDEYKSLLKHYYSRFSTRIKDTIQEEIIGISEYKLDDWIEEMLIDEIRIAGINKINKIHDVLEENALAVERELELGKNADNLLEAYEEIVSRIARRDDSEWLDEIINDFRRQITKKLLYYCDPFNGISQHNIESKIDNISYELRSRLRKLASDFIEEYKQMLKIELNKNIKQVRKIIDELYVEKTLTEEELEEFTQKLDYSGYKLIQEDNKLYAENIKTGKIVELKYNKRHKTLSSVDNSLGFQITKQQYQSVDMNTKRVVIVNDTSVITCDTNKKFQTAIVQKIEGYEFYYGYKKVTSMDEISIVIEKIKEQCPQYYNKLLDDPIFKEIVDKTKIYEEETREIYLDEQDGKVKINQKTKKTVLEKLRLFGYSAIEKDDGLYLIDLTTNEEHKVEYRNGFCLLPGLKAYEFNLCTDIHVVYEDKISLHHSKMKKGNTSIHIRPELSKYIIFIGDDMYSIKVTDNGLECNAKDKDNKPLDLTEAEILLRIKSEFPYVVEHLEQQLSANKSHQSSQNISEEKALLEMTKDALKQGQSLNSTAVSTGGPKK